MLRHDDRLVRGSERVLGRSAIKADDVQQLEVAKKAAPRTSIFHLSRSPVAFNSHKAIEAAKLWLKTKQGHNPEEEAPRFLYAVTLFHQARYPVALSTWAVHGARHMDRDRDIGRFRLADRWLKELHEEGVIHRKVGGFVWMHREVRDSLMSTCKVNSSSATRRLRYISVSPTGTRSCIYPQGILSLYSSRFTIVSNAQLQQRAIPYCKRAPSAKV